MRTLPNFPWNLRFSMLTGGTWTTPGCMRTGQCFLCVLSVVLLLSGHRLTFMPCSAVSWRLRGTLCGSRDLCLCAAPSFVALCPANSNHASLPGLLFPIVTRGLTSFVSSFSRIIHCLMSKVLKALFHIFSNYLVVSVWRVNPALVTPSWPEVPFSLIFKFLYILRIPTFHLSYIL